MLEDDEDEDEMMDDSTDVDEEDDDDEEDEDPALQKTPHTSSDILINGVDGIHSSSERENGDEA